MLQLRPASRSQRGTLSGPFVWGLAASLWAPKPEDRRDAYRTIGSASFSFLTCLRPWGRGGVENESEVGGERLKIMMFGAIIIG